MDAIEAIHARKSIRAFKPDPVSRDILENIMQAALRAPSWGNTQPWEYAVLSTRTLNEVRAEVNVRMSSGAKPDPDISWPAFPASYNERSRILINQLESHIQRNPAKSESSAKWWSHLTQWFNAPNGVIVYIDSSLTEWSVLDVGMSLENLMIAATCYGVGSCAMAAAVHYPDTLRDTLNIPSSKRIIIGLALGYPDDDNPITTFQSSREPIDQLVTWHGFD